MQKNKAVTLVKLGGAVITNKEVPNQVRTEVLSRLIQELSSVWPTSDSYIVLGNGAGSFAHVPATRYQTKKGFISDESRIGMAITQDSAAQINRLVVQACIAQGIPAVSVAPANSIVTHHGQASQYFTEVFEQYLKNELLPVTYGDVIADDAQGCTIWSADTVFSFFAREFMVRGWNVQKIIHVTEAEGVWKNSAKEIYSHITPSMSAEVQKQMIDTKGFDVTGGMWHKISEALKLTELGIQTRILSGMHPGALTSALAGDTSIGTLITSE